MPDSIRERAPEPEFTLEPSRFRWRPDEDASQPVRPSRRRALEALPEGGSVLDVGVGGGASSLGLAAKAGLIVGVDRLAEMLESFTESARAEGVDCRAVLGAWPEAADEVEAVDVAVSHHAIYGVADIEPFLVALTAKARHRVVIEVSEFPPQARLAPLWKTIHGIDRPRQRVADDAEAVARHLGYAVEREDAELPGRTPGVTPEAMAFARRRLYVGPEWDDAIGEFLRDAPATHRVAALWWPGAAQT